MRNSFTRGREPSYELNTIRGGTQSCVKVVPCVFVVVAIVDGVHYDDSEPTGGNCLEDMGDVVNTIRIEHQFLEGIDTYRIYIPGVI